MIWGRAGNRRFLRSGRPRGPGKPLQTSFGEAEGRWEGFPGPSRGLESGFETLPESLRWPFKGPQRVLGFFPRFSSNKWEYSGFSVILRFWGALFRGGPSSLRARKGQNEEKNKGYIKVARASKPDSKPLESHLTDARTQQNLEILLEYLKINLQYHYNLFKTCKIPLTTFCNTFKVPLTYPSTEIRPGSPIPGPEELFHPIGYAADALARTHAIKKLSKSY